MTATSKPKTIYLASYNRHKASEIQDIVGSRAQIVVLDPAAPKIIWHEIGETFEENARIKAYAVREQVRGPVLADDSGLAVDALNGRPGVHSSSFCGYEGDDEANTKALLDAMANIPPSERAAAFICCLLYIDENGKESFFYGQCKGSITNSPRGTAGFGYDPIFIPDGYKTTFSELGQKIKNDQSHRRLAVEKWLESLPS